MGQERSETVESYSWYEIRAVYETDQKTGATIEQMIEGTAPTHFGEEELKQWVADATGRFTHDIERIDVVASDVREHIDDSSVVRTGPIELGGV